MIETLFFFMACILTPMYGDLYCDIEIFIVESQNEMKHKWYEETGDVAAKKQKIKGIYMNLPKYEKRIIYLWAGHDGDYTFKGCTVLWHELQHARGVTHEEMPICKYAERNYR